jgi:hypothetical protein
MLPTGLNAESWIRLANVNATVQSTSYWSAKWVTIRFDRQKTIRPWRLLVGILSRAIA